MTEITWEPKKVKVEELKSNPLNPKISTEIGHKRLKLSLDKFGLAGTMPVNLDMTIIDGHSRKEELIERGIKEVWVSVPSRLLTELEYKEMNALFDVAKAKELDMFMVEQILSDDIVDEWDLSSDPDKKKKKRNGQPASVDEPEAKYPLVPQYDEKHEAIVILCSSSIDTVFIKNALGVGKAMSYKNTMVKETSIVTSKQFIEKWNIKDKK